MNIFFVIFTVFLVLKLMGTLAWPWWQVCLPLMMWFAFLIALTSYAFTRKNLRSN